jgi:hypothetical protein
MTSSNYCVVVVVVEATDAKEVSMGELREQRRQALILRGMAPRTPAAYWAAVHGLAKYYHQRLDTLSEAQLQTSMRSLIEERQLSASRVRVVVLGVRFFYTPPPPSTLARYPLTHGKRTLSARKAKELREVENRPSGSFAVDFHGPFAGVAP